MVAARQGFTLIETMVALIVLAVGVLGAAATATLAARLLREAEAREGATVFGSAVLDSLLLVEAPGEGERVEGRYRARWRATGRTLTLEVTFHDGTTERMVTWEAVHAPAPAELGGEP